LQEGAEKHHAGYAEGAEGGEDSGEAGGENEGEQNRRAERGGPAADEAFGQPKPFLVPAGAVPSALTLGITGVEQLVETRQVVVIIWRFGTCWL
jgi:hypothetical protein